MRWHLSQLNAITIFLVGGVALLLFLYLFSARIDVEAKREPLVPSRLPSLSSFNQLDFPSQSGILLSAHSQPRLDSRTAQIFQKQAAQRKSMFETALKLRNPSVAEVLLPIVAEGGVVFSLGSYDDISFEADYQTATRRAASIITVDMTAASPAALAGLMDINATFVHAKIASKTELEAQPPQYTVADLMKKMGIVHIEMLKMDIEGSEVSVLPQFLNSNSVCQIMVEIHKIAEVPHLLRAIANAGFLLQKYELNAFWSGTGLCEYSFIHESCLEKYGATLLASYLKE